MDCWKKMTIVKKKSKNSAGCNFNKRHSELDVLQTWNSTLILITYLYRFAKADCSTFVILFSLLLPTNKICRLISSNFTLTKILVIRILGNQLFGRYLVKMLPKMSFYFYAVGSYLKVLLSIGLILRTFFCNVAKNYTKFPHFNMYSVLKKIARGVF